MTKFKKVVLKQKIDDVINLLEEYYDEALDTFSCDEAIEILREFSKAELYNIKD